MRVLQLLQELTSWLQQLELLGDYLNIQETVDVVAKGKLYIPDLYIVYNLLLESVL